jgi:hypothetical protein
MMHGQTQIKYSFVSCGDIFMEGNVRSLPRLSGELDTAKKDLSDDSGAFNDFATEKHKAC